MMQTEDIKKLFYLNKEIIYLNHGSFGACPKPIFRDYQNWQIQLEKNPVEFFTKTGKEALNESRKKLADYINCNEQDLVYMPNPTTAINTVINSLNLKAGDEILSTNQEYGALVNTWNYYCKKHQIKYLPATISLPILDKQKFLDQFWSALSSKTKVVFLSHITSATSLILPVKEIIDRARELGITSIIDGAHAPGQIDLNIKDLDPDVYTGANHKWLLAPKGSSFLYVKKSFKNKIDPLIVSWGYSDEVNNENQFQEYLQYNGTRDFSAYLTTPACFKFIEDYSWEKHKLKSRKLLLHFYPIIAKELNSKVLCPVNEKFVAQICSIPITCQQPEELKNLLFNKYKIELPIIVNDNKVYLRISVQAYNNTLEIETLINTLKDIKKSTNYI